MRRGRPTGLSFEQAGNRTVLVGLEFLKAVVHSAKPVPLTDIANEMGMSPSRAHRYISSLCEAGFVRKDEDTGRYGVGSQAIELGIAALSRIDGMDLATKVMEELTGKTGLVSYLCVWGSNGPTVVRRELGAVQTAVRVREGSNLSMLTATGQVFLSYLPDAQTSQLLTRDIQEWNASHDRGDFLQYEEAEKLRERMKRNAIARTKGMRHPNWTAFSCPVFGAGDKFIMALTLIGVSKLFDTRLNGEAASHLKAAASRLSLSLRTQLG